jgi:hypothetical protein
VNVVPVVGEEKRGERKLNIEKTMEGVLGCLH